MTLDGRIATAGGDSRWITGSAARTQVHRLRDQVDVIMVGVGTVIKDDPQLTTRLDQHWRMPRHPLRVIVDSRGRTPLEARILSPDLPGQTLIATANPDPVWMSAVQEHGAKVVQCPSDANGRVALKPLLCYLAEQGHNHVLVEGGATLLGALHTDGLIDEIWAFIGARIVNDALALAPMVGSGVPRMALAHTYRLRRVEQYDQDVLLIASSIAAPWWNIEEVADVYWDCGRDGNSCSHCR
jgi:diaminohydroxyphosphoribosylaminopyrimidine deaminase/5-amino-6-(5-phosphoribosylamino)uracil reductase